MVNLRLNSTPPAGRTLLPFVVCLLLLATGGLSAVHGAETITLPPQTVAPGKVQLTVNLTLPPGHKLNPEAPSSVLLTSQNQAVAGLDKKSYGNLRAKSFPLTLRVPVKPGQTTIQADFKINFCDDQMGLCFMRDATLQLPITVDKNSPQKKLEILYEVKMD